MSCLCLERSERNDKKYEKEIECIYCDRQVTGWDYLKTGNALITQLDYQSNIRKQIKRKNVAILTCKNGVLFIGEWVANARILPNYLDGFYANYFIEETKFGEDFSDFNFEKESVICVAGTSLYRHSQGYFCTEPEFDGYLGMDSNVVQVEKRTELLEKSESKREFMNLKMLFKTLDWKKGDTCHKRLHLILYG